MNSLGNLRGRLILGLIFGLVVVAGLLVYSDFTNLVKVLSDFNWWLLPLILLFTLFNYALRFFKWDVYLRLIGATGVSKKNSLMIFLSGMAMAMTPGKVGEVLKSFLLKQVRGTPIAASAPVVLAERLTDGIAMLILALVGLFQFGGSYRAVMIGVAIFVLVFLFLFQNRTLFDRLLTMGEGVPFLAKRVHSFHAFYDSSYELFRLPNLLFGVGVGVVSWSGEVVAFVLVLLGLGLPFSASMVVLCAFILSVSSLIGAVTFLPGGLGTTDVSITGMLQVLVPIALAPAVTVMSKDTAVAATLLIRFSTLWFGVAIGLIALSLVQRVIGNPDASGPGTPEDDALTRESAAV